jgi:hypothetical protein
VLKVVVPLPLTLDPPDAALAEEGGAEKYVHAGRCEIHCWEIGAGKERETTR